MNPDNFSVPEDVEKQLAAIFTDRYMGAVKSACQRYLREASENKPGVAGDGRTLIEIAEKARDLSKLLKKSNSALNRVHLHLSDNYKVHDVLLEMDDLQKKLRILENRCMINPAIERAEHPRKGREPGSANTAQRALAFYLWEIYRQAHGKPAKRSVVKVGAFTEEDYEEKSIEMGPLSQAGKLLKSLLGLHSDMARQFKEIGEQFNGQKIKKRKRA